MVFVVFRINRFIIKYSKLTSYYNIIELYAYYVLTNSIHFVDNIVLIVY